jgi:hypothetical protein
MLLNQGQGPPGSILSAAGCDLLSHQARPTPYGFAYGHGLQVHQREGFTCLAHGGGMPGYGAFILVDPASGLGTTLMCTTPALDVQELAWKALTLWHQAHLHQPLDKVDLSIPNPMHVENAADFAGTYHGPDQTRLTFFAKAGQLILADQPDPIILESRGADRFYIHHPHFDRFLLHFKRAVADGDRPGPVIEAHYGPDCYARDGAPAAQGADCPPAWDAYPGHYRAHIPWQTNFRIILRKGLLWLVWPDGGEEPLIALANDNFQIGDELSPERLRFGPVVDGQALSANYSGSDYYRFFVP